LTDFSKIFHKPSSPNRSTSFGRGLNGIEGMQVRAVGGFAAASTHAWLVEERRVTTNIVNKEPYNHLLSRKAAYEAVAVDRRLKSSVLRKRREKRRKSLDRHAMRRRRSSRAKGESDRIADVPRSGGMEFF